MKRRNSYQQSAISCQLRVLAELAAIAVFTAVVVLCHGCVSGGLHVHLFEKNSTTEHTESTEGGKPSDEGDWLENDPRWDQLEETEKTQ